MLYIIRQILQPVIAALMAFVMMFSPAGSQKAPEEYDQVKNVIYLIGDGMGSLHLEKAKQESPFGQTIAHGYLTLSMLPYLWDQIIEVNNLERMMNYGMKDMRFGQPVLSGQSIRMKVSLDEIQNLRGAIKTNVKFVIEIQESGKKAVEGIATFIYYFKK